MNEKPDMHCERAEILLAQLVFDDFAAPQEREQLLRHISTCQTCAKKHGELKITAGLLREGLANEPAPRLSVERREKLRALLKPKVEDTPAASAEFKIKVSKGGRMKLPAWLPGLAAVVLVGVSLKVLLVKNIMSSSDAPQATEIAEMSFDDEIGDNIEQQLLKEPKSYYGTASVRSKNHELKRTTEWMNDKSAMLPPPPPRVSSEMAKVVDAPMSQSPATIPAKPIEADAFEKIGKPREDLAMSDVFTLKTPTELVGVRGASFNLQGTVKETREKKLGVKASADMDESNLVASQYKKSSKLEEVPLNRYTEPELGLGVTESVEAMSSSLNEAKIVDNTITTTDILEHKIVSATLEPLSLESKNIENIADENFVTADFGNFAMSSEFTNAEQAAGSITTAKLGFTVISAANVGLNTVSSTNIVDRSISTVDKIKEESSLKPVFKKWPMNPFVMTAKDKLSTFALDTDTASYDIAIGYIRRGLLPPQDAIRIEEFVNAFDYHLPKPQGQMFSLSSEIMPSPFGEGLHSLRIGIKGQSLGRDQRMPAHLVLVIDTSGSMEGAERLGLLKKCLPELVASLKGGDRISIVSYGDAARLVVEHASIKDSELIVNAIAGLKSHGATDLGGGHKLGYEMAARHYRAGQVNRVVLFSDGVANVGATVAKDMLERVASQREQGVSFTAIGLGQGTYDDALLEELADRGDGNYFHIDSPERARKVLVDEFSASFQTMAKDVKLQIQFNPKCVRRFRLLGYENRKLEHVDFRNDKVDAGEFNQGPSQDEGQNAVAVYEVELQDNAALADELAQVSIRYKNAKTGAVEEFTRRINGQSLLMKKLRSPATDPHLFLALAVAEYAEFLRQSEYQQNELEDIVKMVREVARALPQDNKVQEFKDMVERSRGLSRAQ